jgi:hypothetical protein
VAYGTRAAALTNVTASITSVPLFAANPGGASTRGVYNDSSAVLYLKYGTTASATSYTVQVPAGYYFEFPRPIYDGVVEGIWVAANGAARCTEVA